MPSIARSILYLSKQGLVEALLASISAGPGVVLHRIVISSRLLHRADLPGPSFKEPTCMQLLNRDSCQRAEGADLTICATTQARRKVSKEARRRHQDCGLWSFFQWLLSGARIASCWSIVIDTASLLSKSHGTLGARGLGRRSIDACNLPARWTLEPC